LFTTTESDLQGIVKVVLAENAISKALLRRTPLWFCTGIKASGVPAMRRDDCNRQATIQTLLCEDMVASGKGPRGDRAQKTTWRVKCELRPKVRFALAPCIVVFYVCVNESLIAPAARRSARVCLQAKGE
jgi:hypothetical protein